MTNRLLHCDPEALRLLIEDGLPAEQQAEVVGHLDDCTRCQQTIERLAAEESWWDEVRQVGRVGRTRPPFLPGLVASALPAPGAELALAFLDPPADPAHLGRLGPFAVTALIGRGGMGVVFKALDPDLNRVVAIKVLAPEFAGSVAARKRFAREAKAAAAITHPNVVAIHRVDSWKELPYLVMSYVCGRSLQEHLDSEGPLGVRDVLRIGMQVADGLAAAHAHGVVHRDVKPANILLAACGLAGDDPGAATPQAATVKLTDFGLARAADDASLTQSGVIAGTPQYMSPEQARGEPADYRADLFSLGSTLYALCAGHPPFRAEGPLAVLRRICDEQPAPLRSISPAVPAWLEALIDRLLAKDPQRRFQSASEVADLLRGCLAHLEHPSAVPLPAPLAGLPRPRTRWRWVLRSALGVTAVLAGFTQPWPGTVPSEPPPQESEEQPRPSAERKGTPVGEAALEGQLGALQRQADALEADLKRVAPDELGDPAEEVLREVRAGLDALQRDLMTPDPPPFGSHPPSRRKE